MLLNVDQHSIIILDIQLYYNITQISSMFTSSISSPKKVCTIREQIIQCFKQPQLTGKFRFDLVDSLDQVQVHFFHDDGASQTLLIQFPQNYPNLPPKISPVNSCQFPLQIFQIQILNEYCWNSDTKLSQILLQLHQNINKFILSQKIMSNNYMSSQKISDSNSQKKQQQIQSDNQQKSHKKYKRKNSHMNGCADKQLTQTKNLNRHFRSKLRQVHRDMMKQLNQPQDSKFIDDIFTPNRVGFEDIRKTLSNKWFNEGVRRQMNSGQFLHKILRGMMGIKSKKLMIKYYHVMVSAVQEPQSFIRWKYD